MIVLNNTAVSDSCSLSGAATQPFISHGEIYAFAPTGYFLTPLIQSRLTTMIGGSGSGSSTVDPIQKTIFFKGADINLTLVSTSVITAGQYTVTQNNTNVGQLSVLFSGSLPPDGTVNVGFEAIPSYVMQQVIGMSGADLTASDVRAEISAEVTIKGEVGGDSISASPFTFPVSVCTDCVVSNVGPCPYDGTPATGNACNPYQDGTLDCCTDASNNLVCPATTGTAP